MQNVADPDDQAAAAPDAGASAGTACEPVRARNTAPGPARVREIGGPAGPDPTRYGDWEKNGRCIDF
ncbi:MAG: DUF1674 domain-containing protein [Sinobacteraceae bacterium]|nr:DUF1674 domain-containing protein [Nevskiaceae bacterium]